MECCRCCQGGCLILSFNGTVVLIGGSDEVTGIGMCEWEEGSGGDGGVFICLFVFQAS